MRHRLGITQTDQPMTECTRRDAAGATVFWVDDTRARGGWLVVSLVGFSGNGRWAIDY